MQSNNNEGHEEPPHKANDQQGKEHQKPVEDNETNLEFESLSREDLIEWVKITENELAVAKKKVEESSKLAQESVENMDKVSGTSTMDLPSSRLPLPLELNCEIFKCLKLPVQRKFIWGLGRDIYGMFGQKLLKKTKKVCNPHGNFWNRTNTRATISADGLRVSVQPGRGRPNVFAVQPFPISGPQCQLNDCPGTILYYYEVNGNISRLFSLGLSPGAIPDNSWIGEYLNSYAIPTNDSFYECWLAGETHHFELPEGGFDSGLSWGSNVLGCGLVLDPENKLWIFFTLNGKLMGRKVPINPTVDRLFPAVTIWPKVSTIEANFGNDPSKPFEYDIQNCPGLELACI